MANTLTHVDWSVLPEPENDGAADHLPGMSVPAVPLPATDGTIVDLSTLDGTTVLFGYPMTGRPDRDLPENWDMIPGARGCTPQACAFRDLAEELRAAGADRVFGISTQDTSYQREVAERLHLPFALLSDADGAFRSALRLPIMEVEGSVLLKRITLFIRKGVVAGVLYPVFPPDKNASDAISWLESNPN